jgi:hypothetical protein
MVKLAASREPKHELLCECVKGLREKETKGVVVFCAKFLESLCVSSMPRCKISRDRVTWSFARNHETAAWSFSQNVDPKHRAQTCLNSQHVKLAVLREPKHDLLCEHVRDSWKKRRREWSCFVRNFEKAFACCQCHVAKLAVIVF